ncbi:MAG: hypothetical protein ACYC91_17215 [Solirubrobacteraceae bacterium]
MAMVEQRVELLLTGSLLRVLGFPRDLAFGIVAAYSASTCSPNCSVTGCALSHASTLPPTWRGPRVCRPAPGTPGVAMGNDTFTDLIPGALATPAVISLGGYWHRDTA